MANQPATDTVQVKFRMKIEDKIKLEKVSELKGISQKDIIMLAIRNDLDSVSLTSADAMRIVEHIRDQEEKRRN